MHDKVQSNNNDSDASTAQRAPTEFASSSYAAKSTKKHKNYDDTNIKPTSVRAGHIPILPTDIHISTSSTVTTTTDGLFLLVSSRRNSSFYHPPGASNARTNNKNIDSNHNVFSKDDSNKIHIRINKSNNHIRRKHNNKQNYYSPLEEASAIGTVIKTSDKDDKLTDYVDNLNSGNNDNNKSTITHTVSLLATEHSDGISREQANTEVQKVNRSSKCNDVTTATVRNSDYLI
jgi:hypothetical protein